MDKKTFERMLHHFDQVKIEEKYPDWGVSWYTGEVPAHDPYYKYCNSQWRARVHREVEYNTYKELCELRKQGRPVIVNKLESEKTKILDEQYRLKKQIAQLINSKNRLEQEVKKLKN